MAQTGNTSLPSIAAPEDAPHPSHPAHPLHQAWKDDPDLFAEHEFAAYGGDAPDPPKPRDGVHHSQHHPHHLHDRPQHTTSTTPDPALARTQSEHPHGTGFSMPDPLPGFPPLQHADTVGNPIIPHDARPQGRGRGMSTGALVQTRRVNLAATTKPAIDEETRAARGQYWLARRGKGGFPDDHIYDPAFEVAHRVRSRALSVGQQTHQSLASRDSHDGDEEEKKEDPNKLDWEEGDPENPQNWSTKYKWAITLLGALLTVNVTFASSEPSTGTQLAAMELGVGRVAGVLASTSIFLCGYILGPIIWAPLSELVGRKPIFVISLGIYALWQIGCALAQNYETLVICRFFAGTFAAAPLTNSGGLIADIWDPVTRGKAMSLFSGSVFIGPVMGPIVGGFISQSYLGWRWTYWIIMIFTGACWCACVAFLPETYSPVLLARRARKLRKEDPEKNKELYAPHERSDFSLKGIVTRTLGRPFKMLATEPILQLTTIYLSIIYGLLYSLFESFPLIWTELRGFNSGETGLVFIGIGLGTTIGACLNVWLQRGYREQLEKHRGHPPPELRLNSAVLAGPFLVVGAFWLGWTGAYASVPWYVPALGTIVLGVSFTLIFISLLTYLIEVYLMYSASALAANTIIRSAVGAAFPLFTTQMFTGLGIQWACTLVGCIGILLVPVPWLFIKYGRRIRMHSQFAPALDVHIADQIEKEERKEGSPDDRTAVDSASEDETTREKGNEKAAKEV